MPMHSLRLYSLPLLASHLDDAGDVEAGLVLRQRLAEALHEPPELPSHHSLQQHVQVSWVLRDNAAHGDVFEIMLAQASPIKASSVTLTLSAATFVSPDSFVIRARRIAKRQSPKWRCQTHSNLCCSTRIRSTKRRCGKRRQMLLAKQLRWK